MSSSVSDTHPGVEHSLGHIQTLDGWRAIAITLVLVDHAGDSILRAISSSWALGEFASPDTVRPLKEYVGRLGVHLFFSLSGYLITSRLLYEEHARSEVSLKEFYLRRLFRIQPAALAFLVTAAVLGFLGIVEISTLGWIGALAGFANLVPGEVPTWYTGHFWSLAVEEHFYLFWPAAFVMMGSRFRLRGTIVLAITLGLWRFVAIKYQWTTSMNFTIRTDMESQWLVWGCIAALTEKRVRGLQMRASTLRACAGGAAIVLWLPLALQGTDWKIQAALVSLSAMLTPLLFLATAGDRTAVIARFLELPAIAWLGRISFSLYLWQQLFVVWDGARSAAMGILQTLPVGLLAALVCASASYYLVERPMIQLGRQWVSRLRQESARIRPRLLAD